MSKAMPGRKNDRKGKELPYAFKRLAVILNDIARKELAKKNTASAHPPSASSSPPQATSKQAKGAGRQRSSSQAKHTGLVNPEHSAPIP